MTTDRRHRRRRPAAGARVVVAAVSASLTAALMGGMAAGAARKSAPADGSRPVDGGVVGLTPRAPPVTAPSSAPVTTSRAS